MKHVVVLAVLCLAGVSRAWASAADEYVPPPPMPEELRAYFEQALQAERIADDVQRCLAYPDLPGNHWPEGAASVRCGQLGPDAFTLDDLERMLEEPGAAARIDAHLARLLEEHYTVAGQREQIHKFFLHFDAGERSGELAARWLRAAPESAFAMTAMGSHRSNLGWQARGGAYVSETSPQQLLRMGQHFSAAVPLLIQALELEPSLGPACLELAQIGRQSSDALQQAALAQCLERDPLSFYVVRELAKAAEPKWGGSMAALEAAAEYARRHGPQNPALYTFMAEPLSYVLIEEAKPYAEVVEDDLRAANMTPRPGMLVGAGHGSKDPWQKVMLLSQALRFRPSMQETRNPAMSPGGRSSSGRGC